MLAARNIHETNPLLIPGLQTIVDGTKDAYTVEGGQMVNYTVTDKTQFGTWQPDGDLIDLEGPARHLRNGDQGARVSERRHHHEHWLISERAGTCGGRLRAAPSRVTPSKLGRPSTGRAGRA